VTEHDISRARSVFDFHATTIAGDELALADYRGHVLLIVNVASRCGFTPQYAGLERLHRTHRARGFEVLGFPCNQFGAQEPESGVNILAFCRDRYDITFPMFAKVDVNGPSAHPLFSFLTSQKKGLFGSRAIKWNFTKFLVGRDGSVLSRYGSRVAADAIEREIVRAL
jgi:glutathione peroxidase